MPKHSVMSLIFLSLDLSFIPHLLCRLHFRGPAGLDQREEDVHHCLTGSCSVLCLECLLCRESAGTLVPFGHHGFAVCMIISECFFTKISLGNPSNT